LWITRKKNCLKLPVKLALYPYQSRDFGRLPITSGLALETDIVGAGRYVSKVLTADKPIPDNLSNEALEASEPWLPQRR
jgi:hypothetical protein